LKWHLLLLVLLLLLLASTHGESGAATGKQVPDMTKSGKRMVTVVARAMRHVLELPRNILSID